MKDFGVFALLLTRFQGDSKELITGSAVSFSVKLLAAVTAFVVNILIARRLGAEQAGLYYLGLSIITLLSFISVFGLNHILVRQIAQFSIYSQWEKIHGVLLQSILITLPISSVLTILLFSFSDVIADVFSKKELAPIIRWLAIGLPVITIIALFAFSFQGLKKFFLYTILQNPLTQMLIALNIVFLMRPELAIDLAKIHLLSLFCVLSVCVFCWVLLGKLRTLTFSSNRTLLMGAVPMMVSQLASRAQGIGGELFLGYWREAEEVAYFSIANKIAALLGFLLIAVNVVVAPKFAELWVKKDTEQLQAVASFSARLQLLISTPIFILMIIFAKNLLAVFGEEFVEAYGVLVVLLVANYISVLTGSVAWLLKMTGNEAVHKNVVLTSMIISIVIGVILVPVFGAMGAAWMIFSGIVISNVLSWYQAKTILGVNTAKSF